MLQGTYPVRKRLLQGATPVMSATPAASMKPINQLTLPSALPTAWSVRQEVLRLSAAACAAKLAIKSAGPTMHHAQHARSAVTRRSQASARAAPPAQLSAPASQRLLLLQQLALVRPALREHVYSVYTWKVQLAAVRLIRPVALSTCIRYIHADGWRRGYFVLAVVATFLEMPALTHNYTDGHALLNSCRLLHLAS